MVPMAPQQQAAAWYGHGHAYMGHHYMHPHDAGSVSPELTGAAGAHYYPVHYEDAAARYDASAAASHAEHGSPVYAVPHGYSSPAAAAAAAAVGGASPYYAAAPPRGDAPSVLRPSPVMVPVYSSPHGVVYQPIAAGSPYVYAPPQRAVATEPVASLPAPASDAVSYLQRGGGGRGITLAAAAAASANGGGGGGGARGAAPSANADGAQQS